MLQRKLTHSLTCIIQQYVLWFQVSVDDSVLVKVLQPTDDLSCVETFSLLIKTRIFFIHMKPEKHTVKDVIVFSEASLKSRREKRNYLSYSLTCSMMHFRV